MVVVVVVVIALLGLASVFHETTSERVQTNTKKETNWYFSCSSNNSGSGDNSGVSREVDVWEGAAMVVLVVKGEGGVGCYTNIFLFWVGKSGRLFFLHAS